MEKVLENVYLVDTFSYAEKGTISAYVVDFEKAAIIDPGAANGAKILLEELEKAGIKDKVEYLMNTHIHIDHAGGSSILVKHLNAKVVVHPKGVKHIVNPEKLWQASKVVLKELADTYGKPEPVSEDKIIAVEDGQRFDLGVMHLIWLCTIWKILRFYFQVIQLAVISMEWYSQLLPRPSVMKML